jgi:enterochelin esterase-like enzyme
LSLLGTPFLVLMLLVAVLVPTAVAVLWNRWPHRIAWPARVLGLLLVMVMGAGAAATLVNRSFGFYSTVNDLLATSALTYRPPQSFSATSQSGPDAVQVLDPHWLQEGQALAKDGHGSMLAVLMVGRRSGLARHGFVYLPPTWFLDPGVNLPVIEMLHGYPGSPGNFRAQLGVAPILDAEIAARRMPPSVAVFPNTYQQGRASECVNAVSGERDETYLAIDVPDDVQATFGTLGGRSLGLLGYSEGGFCAVNLGLHHPDRVTAAVSLSGYFTAGTDTGTKRLYGGKREALLSNSPVWWARHRSPTAPALLLVSGTDDRESMEQDRSLARISHRFAPKLPVFAAIVPHGAHNFATFDRAMPAALDFLGEHLPGPLAPLIRLPLDRQALAPTTVVLPPKRRLPPPRSTPTPGRSASPRVSPSVRYGPIPRRSPSPYRPYPSSPTPPPRPSPTAA